MTATEDLGDFRVAQRIAEPAKLLTLLGATVITADGTVNRTPVERLSAFQRLTLLLTISGKNMDAATTLDIYVQYSPDEGATWDDLVHFAQITNAAIPNGSYVAFVTPAASAVDRAVTDGTLAAATIRSVSFCDRLRVKTVAANFAGADTITVKLVAFAEGS